MSNTDGASKPTKVGITGIAPNKQRQKLGELAVPQQRAEFLIRALGSQTRVAELLEVSRSQPGKWSKGEESPSPGRARELIDLDHVVARVVSWLGPHMTIPWLNGSNAFLDGARPIDVLVFNHVPSATPGSPGHPSYVRRPQRKGRWDNPSLYDSWYLSTSPEGAIAETFGNNEFWAKAMFVRADFPSGRLTLGIFKAPDDLGLCDLDDANNLLHMGMKPSQVVTRNLPYTQARAAAAFAEGRWAGLGWWSFHRPFWSNCMLWATSAAPAPLTFVDAESLDLSHRSIVSVRATLAMPVR